MSSANIFSRSVASQSQKFFVLMKSSFSILSLRNCAFGVASKKASPCPRLSRFSPVSSSKRLIVLHFISGRDCFELVCHRCKVSVWTHWAAWQCPGFTGVLLHGYGISRVKHPGLRCLRRGVWLTSLGPQCRPAETLAAARCGREQAAKSVDMFFIQSLRGSRQAEGAPAAHGDDSICLHSSASHGTSWNHFPDKPPAP